MTSWLNAAAAASGAAFFSGPQSSILTWSEARSYVQVPRLSMSTATLNCDR